MPVLEGSADATAPGWLSGVGLGVLPTPGVPATVVGSPDGSEGPGKKSRESAEMALISSIATRTPMDTAANMLGISKLGSALILSR